MTLIKPESPYSLNGYYKASIPAFAAGTTVEYNVTAYNNAGIPGVDGYSYKVNQSSSYGNITIGLITSKIDTNTLHGEVGFIVRGYLPRNNYQLPNIEGIDINNKTNIFKIPISVDNKINSSRAGVIDFRSSEFKRTFSLSGNPSSFPFDDYVVNITLGIHYPFSANRIIHYPTAVDDELKNSAWHFSSVTTSTSDKHMEDFPYLDKAKLASYGKKWHIYKFQIKL